MIINKFIIYLILLFPKINVISFQGFNQGIRIDDILIVLLSLLYIGKVFSVNKLTAVIFIYITISSIISFVNNTNPHLMSLFHYIRLIEYILFFLIVSKIFDKKEIFKIILVSFIFLIIFAICEFFLPISDGNRIVTSIFGIKIIRANGTFAGPWEFAIFLGVCFFVISDYILKEKNNKDFYKYYILIWFSIIIAFARAQFVAILISSIFLRNINSLYKVILSLITFFIIISIVFIQYEKGQFGFGYIDFATSINFLRDYGEIILENWFRGDFYLGSGGRYFDITGTLYDPSLVSRLQQWGRYLQTFDYAIITPIAILFGMGPGSGGIINDGMYVKVLVDFGIVGLFIFLYLNLKFFLKKSTRALTIFLSISCITLDVYWSTKIGYVVMLALVYFNSIEKN